MRVLIETKRVKDRLEQSSARLHRISEKSFDGMRLIDDKGYIVSVNESFCTMVGIKKRELIGKPYHISEHTQATFTHALCPDCLKEAYEELEAYKRKMAGSG